MNTSKPVRFTEPTEEELLAVTDDELRIAKLLMCEVNPAFNTYVHTPRKGVIAPCLYRMH